MISRVYAANYVLETVMVNGFNLITCTLYIMCMRDGKKIKFILQLTFFKKIISISPFYADNYILVNNEILENLKEFESP